jgi:prepilin-type N-terminal cleavage/methylation domain-containing protein
MPTAVHPAYLVPQRDCVAVDHPHVDNDTDSSARRLDPRRGAAGFTLIEFLMTITIIGILAAIATPFWLDQRVRAYDAAAKSDLHAAAVQAAIHAEQGDELSSVVEDVNSPRTDGVALELIAYDRLVGYCLSAQHEASPNVWSWDSLHPGIHENGMTCSVGAPQGDAPQVGSGGAGAEHDCNNGVNKGNLDRCEDFPGKGGRGSANH